MCPTGQMTCARKVHRTKHAKSKNKWKVKTKMQIHDIRQYR